MSYTIIDLSLIFNETGYINNKNHHKYEHNMSIEHVILTQSINSPVKINDDFLSFCFNIISVDTSKLVNVVAIGNNFCHECHKLTKFDTSGLTKVTTIGDYFCYCCCKLTNFDTTELASLITIGGRFLYNCENLTNFDTTKLISLTSIGIYFFCSGKNLLNFDATGLKSLVNIEGNKLFIFCNKNLTITIKNPPNCLYEQLINTNYKIVQLYDKPCIYLDNDCVI